jgi:hypothetical protein
LRLQLSLAQVRSRIAQNGISKAKEKNMNIPGITGS